MKFQIVLTALTSLAAASPIGGPIAIRANQPLAGRQVSDTENELENGACRRITFIFARGSTESGNFGTSVGPPTCQDLKTRYGANNVACQGVGGPYDASLADNFLPLGTSTAAIGEAERLFNLANTKCPSTIITGGGYSQGGAVISAAIPALSSTVQNKIVGVVLYGDSRNTQDGGRIPNFPAAKTDIICNVGDLICDGTLVVTAAHLAYDGETQAGANFLISKIGN